MDRRKFLFATALTWLGVRLPAARAILAPDHPSGGSDTVDPDAWSVVGPVKSFKVGVITRATISVGCGCDEQVLYVKRTSSQDFVVFSTACPHMGCSVSWHAGSKHFVCPCHDGIFDSSGKVIGGPPKQALDQYTWAINGKKELIVNPNSASSQPDTDPPPTDY